MRRSVTDPYEARRYMRAEADLLTRLRIVWIAFVLSLPTLGILVAVLVVTGTEVSRTLEVPAAAVVSGYGVVSLGAPRLLPGLDASDAGRLRTTYRRRFLLHVAVADIAAYLGFAAFLVTGRAWWLYPLGGVFTLVGFARAAPTANNLAADQQRLLADGSGVSLVAALRERA